MKNIKDMTPAESVAAGYDAVADLYLDFITTSRQREQKHYLQAFSNSLSRGADVLDLGCGAGIPTTHQLAQHFSVTGVEISSQQIERARKNVPDAKFIQADLTQVEFDGASFDGVLAFYSLFHIPRTQHGEVLKRIQHWLRPNGIFVGCFMAAEHESQVLMDESMLNAPMFLSSNDPKITEKLIRDAGFGVVSAIIETDTEKGGGEDSFFWVVARKAA